MSKKILTVVLSLTLTFSALFVGAGSAPDPTRLRASAASEEDLTYKVSDDGITVSGYVRNPAGKLVIPKTIDGKPVTKVGDRAFYGCGDLTSVTIPEGVTHIGGEAFYNCAGLTSVKIPESATSIGNGAFVRCVSLTEIAIAPGNPNYSSLDGAAFSKDGTTLIQYPAGNPRTAYTVPDGVTSISGGAFYGCKNLTSATIPGSVARIGCYSSGGYYYSGAFENCAALKKVVVLDGAAEIGDCMFSNCASLTDATIPESATRIGKEAFYGCSGLTSVRIPESVTSVGEFAFSSCDGLTDITVDENNPEYSDIDGVFCNKDKTTLICYPQGKTAAEYKTPDGAAKIYSHAFSGCQSLKKIIISDDAEEIGVYAFSGCKNLISAAIPGGGTRIGTGAFMNCVSLTDAAIPSDATQLGASAFAGCSGLTSVTIPGGITSLPLSAFQNCSNLTGLTIKKGVKRIGSNAFCDCVKLESVRLPDSATEIGSGAFSGCSGISDVYYGGSPEDWGAITVGAGNDGLLSADIHYNCPPDTDDRVAALNESVERANNAPRALYTESSLAALDAALAAVDLDAEGLTPEQIDGWKNDIDAAIAALEYRPADYGAVELAKTRAENVNRTVYTSESLAAVDEAVSAVVYGLDITGQETVDSYARAIDEALGALKLLPADYSGVEAAITEYDELDREPWSPASLAVLDQRVRAVEYGLDITKQEKVDAYADGIRNAVKELKYDEITLADEFNGVIIRATTKEIRRSTLLVVEPRDPSDFEGSNFAVGGTIISMKFYDISLFLEGEEVQPDGTVTVKIKLAEGVDPQKCKVYHVTNDAVDPLVRVTSTISGNYYAVFETDRFSAFAVIEVETVLTELTIAREPYKKDYLAGEPLDLAGLEVVAKTSDGVQKPVSDYNVAATDMNEPGEKTITVYYTAGGVVKSASFKINVSPARVFVKNASIDAPETLPYGKTARPTLNVEEENAEPYEVEWRSSDPSIAEVDPENGTIVARGDGEATVYAEITNADGSRVEASVKIKCVMTLWQKITAFFKKIFDKAFGAFFKSAG